MSRDAAFVKRGRALLAAARSVLRAAAAAVWRWIRDNIGAREIMQTIGLGMLATGAGMHSLRSGLITAGAVILYLSVWHTLIANRMMR